MYMTSPVDRSELLASNVSTVVEARLVRRLYFDVK
jgi:hypothetical protein